MQPTQHPRRTALPHARTARPLAALAAGVLALGAACADSPTSPDARSAAAVGPSASLGLPNGATADTLAVGGTVQLTASLRTGRHSTTPVWRSSDATVATVSQSGLVTAVAAGSATVTVSNSSSSSSATVVVTATAPTPTPSTSGGSSGAAARVLAFMGASNVATVAALQAKGGAYARYESDFATYANNKWATDSTSFDANFYDRAMIYYVWWARTGNATYLDRANKLAVAARSYIQSTNYYPQAYNLMIDGVALHALVTGDQQSAATVVKTADAMAAPNTYWSYVVGDSTDPQNDSRSQARILGLVLDAYLLKVPSPAGLNYASRLTDLENKILNTQAPDGGFHWRNQCGYTKPWMTGMLNDELIRYYTSFQADSRIVSSVKRSADYAWNVDWVSSANAFKYMDADCSTSGEGSGATADLNNLISSSFAFVAKQTGDASYYTKGDASFAGGVYGAWLGGSKQFNQEYTASYRFLSFRF